MKKVDIAFKFATVRRPQEPVGTQIYVPEARPAQEEEKEDDRAYLITMFLLGAFGMGGIFYGVEMWVRMV